MKRLYYILIMLLVFLPDTGWATDKAEADSAYAKENFQEAARLYETLLKQGNSADVYYNLGNCYYRLEKMGLAVLNYERALRLNPGDSQIRHNLELANGKTVDKIVPVSEVFIVTWYKTVTNWCSVDRWAGFAIATFILFLLLMGLYLFGSHLRFRQIGFYAGVFSLVVCVLCNVLAWSQKQHLLNRNAGVVMIPEVHVKSTPSVSGTDLFVIHEGTKVNLIDTSMKSWKEIQLGDGKTGWIPTESMELI